MLYPKYPDETFWNTNRSLRLFSRRRAHMPPLGLLTIASYLPEDFKVRIIDRNVREETDADYRWADVVFLSAMGIQQEDYRFCVSKAKLHGTPIALGGPFTHAFPEVSVADADWVCFGEAETIMPELVNDLRGGRRGRQYQGGHKTEMESVKAPRFDLLENINDYRTMPVQFSRGCPFECEFCDIIEIYGRVPRAKTPAQFLAELSALRAQNFSGTIFIVDDNFIGNRKKAKGMLKELAIWNRKQGYPYRLTTEASLNLADDEEMMALMEAADLSYVFIGIETPDPLLLKVTLKKQNIPGNPLAKLQKIREHGIHIMAGFIVGFDGEKKFVFDTQRDFIQASGIGLAVLSLLVALPHTQLSRRLLKEKRLLENLVPMENTLDGINFIPKGELTKREYLEGFCKLYREVYEPKSFFHRIMPALLMLRRKRWSFRFIWQKILAHPSYFLRQTYYLGLRERGSRRYYWRALLRLLWKNPSGIEAFCFDCYYYFHISHHGSSVQDRFSRYLQDPSPEDVLDQVANG